MGIATMVVVIVIIVAVIILELIVQGSGGYLTRDLARAWCDDSQLLRKVFLLR